MPLKHNLEFKLDVTAEKDKQTRKQCDSDAIFKQRRFVIFF